MISQASFLSLVARVLKTDLRDADNKTQRRAVTFDKDQVLQIVAGPGSGKTTVLVLRALRAVLVDDELPEHVLLTTFTRKAARELRSRWLDWGAALLDDVSNVQDVSDIDLNRCTIDTLDSVIQTVLAEHRVPGSLAPVVVDAATSVLTLKRGVFAKVYWTNQDVIDPLLARYTFDRRPPRNQAEALLTTKRLLERLAQDRVDIHSYAGEGRAQELIVEMLREFRQIGHERNVFDFTTLQEEFLERLTDGQLEEWTTGLRVILVDEYQDTNPLQEAIYFSLMRVARPSMTIVGDDDQSMYRFRGGSVELFTEFAARCDDATGQDTARVDMTRNFRSTPEIVDFFNRHIESDPRFQPARVTPPKPRVVPTKPSTNVPVLGMFRESEQTLADDLANFLASLASGESIRVGTDQEEVRLAPSGTAGDAAFLSHSVEELSYSRYTQSPDERFPGMLRTAMSAYGIEVFNPRGRPLRSVPDVQQLLGLVILAVDPDGSLVRDLQLTNEANYFLREWRKMAVNFVDTDPSPNDGRGISGFIGDWQKAAKGHVVDGFPADSSEWPVLELLFKLITWIPAFQQDAEAQVWLEAVARTVASTAIASPYSMRLLQNVKNARSQGDHVVRSRESLIRDALVPIAEGEVQVDEDILPSVPRHHVQFMTIHQAKGLEFPLVIVNAGSRFKMNHSSQRFLRFPDRESNVVIEETDVEDHLPSPLRVNREPLDRTFDDLVRLYYVAYSRPQSVLMLVGHEKNLAYGKGRHHSQGAIPNLALGWHRDGSWPWRQSYSDGKPPVKVDPVFFEV